MKKSFRSTLILLGVFIALIVWYQVYEKKIKPKRTEAEEKIKEIFTLSKDDIQEIEIDRLTTPPPDTAPPGTAPISNEYSKIRLKLAGKDWNLVEPVQDGADAANANSLVSTLTGTKQERVVDEAPKDFQQYGLTTPLFKITARKGGAEKAESLKVGSNTPTGFSSYLQIGDSPKVYRVSRALRTAVDKPVKEFRNKSIVNWTRADVTVVEIQAGKENIVMSRPTADKEEWDLAREHIPADTTEWNKTLNGLLEVKATEFAAENEKNLAKFGLSSPSARIQLKGKDNKKLGIRIGKTKDKTYLVRDDRPIVYEVDKDILAKVETKAEKYRSMRLANFNRFDVKRIKLERGKETIELLKEDKTGWTFPTEPNTKINPSRVDTLLTQLQDIKISRYLAPSSPKVAASQLTIRLFEKKEEKEKEQVNLLFGKAQGKLIPANRSDLDLSFLLSEDDFKKLNLQSKDFIKTEDKKEEPTKVETKKS